MNWQQFCDLGTNAQCVFGDEGEFEVNSLCEISKPEVNSLCFLKDKKYIEKIGEGSPDDLFKQTILLIDADFFHSKISENDVLLTSLKEKFGAIITTYNYQKAVVELSQVFFQKKFEKLNLEVDGRKLNSSKIHPSAQVSNLAFIGENVAIDEGAIILPHCSVMAGSHIGANTVLFPHVTCYPFVNIGKSCRINSGVVIGGDGFGYNFYDGHHNKIWHMGGVHIYDNVEIGANSCVDGGTFGPTIIGEGTKIDNHVQLGHNVTVGKHVIICGHVGIGGSCEIGDYCVFGGKSGTGDNIKLGKNCQIAGGALVNCDWPDKSVVGGHPARPLKEWMKGLAYVRKESLKK